MIQEKTMGMFDYLKCEYPLPVEGFEGRLFQTKDTPEQSLDHYVIKEDGTLWHYGFDAKGWGAAANARLRREPFTGDIEFHGFKNTDDSTGWVSFWVSFYVGKIDAPILFTIRDE
jgi:hypothetical protein